MKKNILYLIALVIGALLVIRVGAMIINSVYDKGYKKGAESQTSTPPFIISPEFNSKVVSPLTVKGVVPTGWMFEGNVSLKLLDADRNVIAKAAGTEVNPGNWMDENPDEFTSTIIFTTTAKNGFLLVSADNPSDLPHNTISYEIPVKF